MCRRGALGRLHARQEGEFTVPGETTNVASGSPVHRVQRAEISRRSRQAQPSRPTPSIRFGRSRCPAARGESSAIKLASAYRFREHMSPETTRPEAEHQAGGNGQGGRDVCTLTTVRPTSLGPRAPRTLEVFAGCEPLGRSIAYGRRQHGRARILVGPGSPRVTLRDHRRRHPGVGRATRGHSCRVTRRGLGRSRIDHRTMLAGPPRAGPHGHREPVAF